MSEPLTSWEQKTLKELLLFTHKEFRRGRRWRLLFRFLVFFYIVGISAILLLQDHPMFSLQKETFVAVVPVDGVVGPERSAGARQVVKNIRRAIAHPMAKGVIIKVNSQGGAPVQGRIIYRALMDLQAQYPHKKLVTVIEDMGLSAGYLIACGCQSIYADHASLVGSIGARLSTFGVVEAMNKLGVERRLYTAGDHKGMLDPFSPAHPLHEDFITNSLNTLHQVFIKDVQDSRGQRLKPTQDLYSGRFWTGSEAYELGLIDGFGDAAAVAQEVFETTKLVEFRAPKSLFTQLQTQARTLLEPLLAWHW